MEALQAILLALTFNAVDLITGIVSALKNGKIKSSKLRDGLFKKVGFIVCYFMAWLLDTYGCLVGFTYTIHVLPIILFYACTTELVSIIENIHKMNPNILPEKLLKIFQMDEKGE